MNKPDLSVVEYRLKMLAEAGCTITIKPTGVAEPPFRLAIEGPYGSMSGGKSTFYEVLDWAFYHYLQSIGFRVLAREAKEREEARAEEVERIPTVESPPAVWKAVVIEHQG